MRKGKKLAAVFLAMVQAFAIPTVVNAMTQWVTIEDSHVVLDSFHGVDAVYSSNHNSASDPIYSCAAYVKKYYDAVYGLSVYNLMDDGPPLIEEREAYFVRTEDPEPGDIVFWPTSANANNHSAIIKEVDGNRLTLIEQNYKTGTIAAVNREITYPSNRFVIYTLSGEFEEVEGEEDREYRTLTPSYIERNFEYYADVRIVSIEGKRRRPDIEERERDGYASYYMELDEKEDFMLESDYVEGWYVDGGYWEPIRKGRVFNTDEAYFTVYTPEEKVIPVYVVYEPVLDMPSFTDLPEDHWAYEAVKACVEKGVLSGYGDDTFRPDQVITRGELAVSICNFLGIDVTGLPVGSFPDVSAGDWYSAYIEAARFYLPPKENAWGTMVYLPEEPVRREDISEAIIRMADLDPEDSSIGYLEDFQDKYTISNEKMPYVALAVEMGYLRGFEDDTFRPEEPITRAQAAVIFYQLMQ